MMLLCGNPDSAFWSLRRVHIYQALMPSICPAVVLMASKTWNGHAEPAAGLVAMLHAKQTVNHAAALPLPHLRHLNPYVATALDASKQRDAVAWGRASRQPGASGMARSLSGISAFAFQVRSCTAGSRFRRDVSEFCE